MGPPPAYPSPLVTGLSPGPDTGHLQSTPGHCHIYLCLIKSFGFEVEVQVPPLSWCRYLSSHSALAMGRTPGGSGGRLQDIELDTATGFAFLRQGEEPGLSLGSRVQLCQD